MHPEITAAATGQCPICKMAFVAGNPLDTREYELDFSTSPAAVRAGTPFTITLTVKDGDEAITKFEEVHDKRYHLFIISRDMTVFEHVHPVLQPSGAWELEATLPKAGLLQHRVGLPADRWSAAGDYARTDHRRLQR